MLKNIDFYPGKVVYSDLDFDEKKQPNKHDNALQEDLLQVEYPHDIIIDVGWYSNIERFIVYVIKNNNWTDPLIKKTCKNWGDVEAELAACINYVKKILVKG